MGCPEQSVENFSLTSKVELPPSTRISYTFEENTSIFSKEELSTMYSTWTLPTTKQNFINMSHYIYTSYNSSREFKLGERNVYLQCPFDYIKALFDIMHEHITCGGSKHTFM